MPNLGKGFSSPVRGIGSRQGIEFYFWSGALLWRVKGLNPLGAKYQAMMGSEKTTRLITAKT